jgi:ferredoxin
MSPKRPYSIHIKPSAMHFEQRERQSLLQSALAQAIRLPSSCRNGTCRTCMCKLESGVVAYQIEWPGLTREEKQEGWILPCVAEAQSDLVIAVSDAIDLKN